MQAFLPLKSTPAHSRGGGLAWHQARRRARAAAAPRPGSAAATASDRQPPAARRAPRHLTMHAPGAALLLLLLVSTCIIAPVAAANPAFSYHLPPTTLHRAASRTHATGSPSRHDDTHRSALQQPWGGLSAKDFGCVGDGQADDGPALQRAIDAALDQGRTLLLPAGHYRVNSTLNVASSARRNYAVPGPGYAKHSLRLVGEGLSLTSITAAVEMHAVLNFSANNSKTYGPAAPEATEGQYMSDLSINAAGKANYSIFAPGIARSRFERVDISGALSVGLSIGYGWCNCEYSYSFVQCMACQRVAVRFDSGCSIPRIAHDCTVQISRRVALVGTALGCTPTTARTTLTSSTASSRATSALGCTPAVARSTPSSVMSSRATEALVSSYSERRV